MKVRESLCVALDGSDREWIRSTAAALSSHVGWLKIGLEAFSAHGPELITELADLGPKIFLDLKLHDIPATVHRAAVNCATSGASLLTVHAAGGRTMMKAAVAGALEGASKSPPKIVAVTLLTSLDETSLAELGIEREPALLVESWADLAARSGLDGVVASAREAAAIRRRRGTDFLIVTPGIRPASALADDQRRVVTPGDAIRAGADILVVGRPITGASDPVAAASDILDEMAAVN